MKHEYHVGPKAGESFERLAPSAPGLFRRGGRPGKSMSASLLPPRVNPPASPASANPPPSRNLSSPSACNP